MKRLVLVLSALLWSTKALAQDAAPDASSPEPLDSARKPEPPTTKPAPVAEAPAAQPASPRYDLFEVSAGMRQNYVKSTGFDPYSSNDVLTQASLGVTVPVLHRGKLALAAGAGYSAGGSTSTLRGDATHLFVHEISAVIEGRFHFAPWSFAFARVAPGAVAMLSTVAEGSAPSPIASTRWAFATDLSAGAAFLIGPRGPDAADKRTPRFWILPEIGYALSTKATFDSRPDRDAKDVLGADQRIATPALAMNAFFWRITAAATF